MNAKFRQEATNDFEKDHYKLMNDALFATYDFYYNILYAKFGRKMKLLFTDTDSLCIQVQTPSLADFLDGLEEKFDTSNFPKEPKYSDINKKFPGK